MKNEAEQVVGLLLGEIKRALGAPGADAALFATTAFERLRAIPPTPDVQVRINCLLDIATLFYHQGETIISGLEPAAMAVSLSRECEDRLLLRRSLTIYAVILLSTNYQGDAIVMLREALEIAEEINDIYGKIVCWINLGTAFYEAGLYKDASQCAKTAAREAEGSGAFPHVQISALANVGLYCLHLQEYHAGLDAVRRALAIGAAPEAANDFLARVFLEGTHTRLLLATGQIAEAAERARLAKDFAAKACSVRGDISAACSEGLVEVYAGSTLAGLARGMAALEKAREIRPSLSETLMAQIQAHERAGLQDKALELHRELTLHLQRIQNDCLLDHHEVACDFSSSQQRSNPLTCAVIRRRVAAALAVQ